MAPCSADVAIIGGGPVGCVTALAFARNGARVVLLEADPRAANRLAGEWLHPPGAAVLDQLGLAPALSAAGCLTGRGFVVFPDDGSEPIVLDYPGARTGLSCEHRRLVTVLREAAAAHPAICYRPHARVTALCSGKVSFEDPRSEGGGTVLAERVVGADGRSSLARRWLGLSSGTTTRLSSMAGVLLEDAELPREGFGHVFLGGPGPILAYRISPRQVRACLDVPDRHGFRPDRGASELWEAYRAALPPPLRPAFQRALQARPITWAANQHRARRDYGQAGLALVGDAVGMFHPLTAVGLTLGFMDGECLARAESYAAYRRERTSCSRVAELLAASLYPVFTLQDAGTAALRCALYRMWRADPTERGATMRLLSGQDPAMAQFSRAFLKVMSGAAATVAGEAVSRGHWTRAARAAGRLGQWLRWLAGATLLDSGRLPAISASASSRPCPRD